MYTPEINKVYRHFKGNYYRVVAIAIHSETREELVIYQALYGDGGIYARPLTMFTSPVDHVKYPEVEQELRFQPVDDPVILKPDEAVKLGSQYAAAQTTGAPKVAEPVKTVSAPKPQEPGDETVHPAVIEYLDADTYGEKLRVLCSVRDDITKSMLETMAIAIDVQLNDEDDLEAQFEDLKYCLSNKERFECTRLR
ncbi:MAG: DUF1653 domain-containing protein [Lachnospiraceae bacterium]|nr:DUF1653 domain-containing protein [Lachnospiraceae bacterium]